MIRSKYLMSQEICCGVPGQFYIHQHPQKPLQQEDQKQEGSELEFSPQQYVGQFKEKEVSKICCCSFKPIKSLQLQIYGQRLSIAHSQSTCCLNPFKEQLIVSSINNVQLGKILKVCGVCSKDLMLIQNQSGQQILKIQVQMCQLANICPRMLKCKSSLVYRILDSKGKEVGTIINVYRSCLNNFFCLRDDFEVNFTGIEKEKQKILVFNAVVFINQLKHQLF